MTGFARVLTFPSPILNRYIKTLFPKIGRVFESDFVAMHAWSKGAVEVTRDEAQVLEAARKGRLTGAREEVLSRLPESFSNDTLDINGVVDRTAGNFTCIQHYSELRDFLSRVAKKRPKTVVEIGTARGGVFFALCQVSAPDATLVSLDIGAGGAFGGGQTDEECELFGCFGYGNQDVRFVRGSSLAMSSVYELRDILGDRKVDVLFIDGNHNYGAVKSDYEMYRPFVAPDGLICFHDITTSPETHGKGMDVAIFWDELKKARPTHEIISGKGVRSYAEMPARWEAFLSQHPDLVQATQEEAFDERELLAIGMQSEFVKYSGPLQKHMQIFKSTTSIPDEIQMAWGIGVIQLGG